MTSNRDLSITESAAILPELGVARSPWKRAYQIILLATDALMLLIAFELAYVVRFTTEIPIFRQGVSSVEHYTWLVLILLPVWLTLFALLQLYDFHLLLSGTSEYARALNGCTSGMMLVVVVSFVIPEFIIARGWLILAWLLSSLLVCTNRWFWRRVAHAMRHRGWFVTRAIIVGTNAEALSLAAQLRESFYSGFRIVGFIQESDEPTAENAPPSIMGLPVLGTLAALPTVLQQKGIEEVIIAATALTRPQLLGTTLQLSAMPAVNMALSSGLYEIFTTGVRVSTRNSVPLLRLNRLRLEPAELILKTLLDYTIISFGAILLLPFIGIIALLIKLDSPGPVFYRRRVLGVGGNPFDAFKFRTMFINGDAILAQYPDLLAELQTNHKLKQDPRITKVGAWLRRTSLDELPQFFNVLLGQMSLVGPRMITTAEAAMYGVMKQNLLTVKPGITGLCGSICKLSFSKLYRRSCVAMAPIKGTRLSGRARLYPERSIR
ncbi:MAG: sugar transferase [Caldilinea sp. CFX5]|nr:sugar transferase [Caldilinea sp. CFX5]